MLRFLFFRRTCENLVHTTFKTSEDNYCYECGKKLQDKCRNCGNKRLYHNAKFCHLCGADLNKTKEDESKTEETSLLDKISLLLMTDFISFFKIPNLTPLNILLSNKLNTDVSLGGPLVDTTSKIGCYRIWLCIQGYDTVFYREQAIEKLRELYTKKEIEM